MFPPVVPVGWQRSVLLALALLPLLAVTTALLPALLVLPFLPKGVERCRKLLAEIRCWVMDTLRSTQG